MVRFRSVAKNDARTPLVAKTQLAGKVSTGLSHVGRAPNITQGGFFSRSPFYNKKPRLLQFVLRRLNGILTSEEAIILVGHLGYGAIGSIARGTVPVQVSNLHVDREMNLL